MDDLAYWLFLINIGWIATHELDAIQHHEWRIFPVVASLPETMGYRIFTALHIPLFAIIIYFVEDHAFQIGFDIFLIVHVGLHWLFRNHPQYEFNNWFSRLLIIGGGLLGGLHLIILNL